MFYPIYFSSGIVQASSELSLDFISFDSSGGAELTRLAGQNYAVSFLPSVANKKPPTKRAKLKIVHKIDTNIRR